MERAGIISRIAVLEKREYREKVRCATVEREAEWGYRAGDLERPKYLARTSVSRCPGVSTRIRGWCKNRACEVRTEQRPVRKEARARRKQTATRHASSRVLAAEEEGASDSLRGERLRFGGSLISASVAKITKRKNEGEEKKRRRRRRKKKSYISIVTGELCGDSRMNGPRTMPDRASIEHSRDRNSDRAHLLLAQNRNKMRCDGL